MEHMLREELERRIRLQGMPYRATLTTLLGPEAFVWLTAASESGVSRIQPHELSRVGWPHLDSISNQIEIETKLAQLDADNSQTAKSMVTLAWTVVALMSLVDASIFVSEHASYVSSIRHGQVT